MKKKIITLPQLEEKLQSVLADFHAGLLSYSTWGLERLFFFWREMPRVYGDKPSEPNVTSLGSNLVTLVGGEHSHHHNIPA